MKKLKKKTKKNFPELYAYQNVLLYTYLQHKPTLTYMLHYYDVSNSGPLYPKRLKLTATLTLPYRKLVLFNLYKMSICLNQYIADCSAKI